MFNSCLNFLIDFFGNVFSFLDSCMLTSTVSILGIIVAAILIYVLVDNFLPKG